MELKDVCGIAEHTGIRIVVSYSGNGKFALGLSDGSTTPKMNLRFSLSSAVVVSSGIGVSPFKSD